MTKIVGNLPSGDANGLHIISRALVNDTEAHHVVVAVLKTKKITTDVDSGDVEATAKIVRIEVVDPQDKETAERLLRRAVSRRHGGDTLPIEMEDEITAIFDNLWVDTSTGEVLERTDDGEEDSDA
jgi:hypothetical protein